MLDPTENKDQTGFTDHIQDDATGLTYMQARYYDPVVGRFLSIDPVGFVESNPMSFNRYLYANNNPYTYADPDGRIAFAIPVVIWGGRIAYVAYQAYRARHVIAAGVAIGGMLASSDDQTNSGGDSGPDLPDKLVGGNQRPAKGRVNSDPLAPENGGTGDAEDDFEVLTGGKNQPAPEDSTLPEGSRVGDNEIILRPGPAGPRIDIPANGDKPRETLHYPPREETNDQ